MEPRLSVILPVRDAALWRWALPEEKRAALAARPERRADPALEGPGGLD